MKHEKIDEICNRIEELLAQSPLGDIRQNVKAIIVNNLSKIDLVTREEFDIQTSVLKRAQDKLEALEKKIAEMSKAADK
ncbi:MAG: phosphoheptose isomerase [Proteobacteria bacterium]|nr:phosphoheptose isomerase [Pseudomonadota bacterium]